VTESTNFHAYTQILGIFEHNITPQVNSWNIQKLIVNTLHTEAITDVTGGLVVSATLRTLYRRERDSNHSRGGRVGLGYRKSPPPGFERRTTKPVPCSYSD
jgi:hypothetical protein